MGLPKLALYSLSALLGQLLCCRLLLLAMAEAQLLLLGVRLAAHSCLPRRFGPFPQRAAGAFSSARSAAGGWLACCPPPARSSGAPPAVQAPSCSERQIANLAAPISAAARRPAPPRPSTSSPHGQSELPAGPRVAPRGSYPVVMTWEFRQLLPRWSGCVGARTSHLCYNGRRWFIGRDYGAAFCRPCSCRCRNQRQHLESSNLLDLFPLLYDHVMILSLPARRILMMRQVY